MSFVKTNVSKFVKSLFRSTTTPVNFVGKWLIASLSNKVIPLLIVLGNTSLHTFLSSYQSDIYIYIYIPSICVTQKSVISHQLVPDKEIKLKLEKKEVPCWGPKVEFPLTTDHQVKCVIIECLLWKQMCQRLWQVYLGVQHKTVIVIKLYEGWKSSVPIFLVSFMSHQ